MVVPYKYKMSKYIIKQKLFVKQQNTLLVKISLFLDGVFIKYFKLSNYKLINEQLFGH